MTNDERRDMFAAAAMTGVITTTAGYTVEQFARECYEHADAMLRERERTNLDAAPAARAAEQARSPDQSPRGTGGTTREPVLWGLSYGGRPVDSGDVYALPIQAETAKARCTRSTCEIVPLYRDPPPALTDAERSVLRGLRDDYAFRRSNQNCQRVASVLDGILARLGGTT